MFLGPSDWTPLHRAVWSQNADEVEVLAEHGNLNVVDQQGWTPLHLACAAESSMLFGSHQISGRGYSRFSSGGKRYVAREWGPNRATSYLLDKDERVDSLEILRILLRKRANVHSRALGFCTPLHCAANSGWLSHALALVRAGARVYTGPECSPLCWVKGGSGGDNLVARYLRGELGDPGLTLIEQDHARVSGTLYKRVLPRHEEPMFFRTEPHCKSQTSSTVNADGLCTVCSGMTLQSFLVAPGFMHLTFEELRRSAASCSFCRIIVSALAEGQPRWSGIEGQILISAPHEPDVPLDTLQIDRSAGCRCDLDIPFDSSDTSVCPTASDIILQTARVTIFTKQDMPGSTPIIRYGSDLSECPDSASTLEFMKKCLEECNTNHPGCKPQSRSTSSFSEHLTLPSRLIEVSDGIATSIRIVDGFGRSGRYAAFSHRWVSGPRPQWVTLQDTIEQRRSWFSTVTLPASIVDAIKTTRRLQLDYVWIDSLCIIQDSEEDWNAEAAKMADVYANAHVTIFADAAKDDGHGFLGPRKVFRSTSITISDTAKTQVVLQIRRSSPSAWNYPKGSLFVSDTRELSYLSKRAWILQERLLSRRKLHFGAHQVYWMCRECVIAEDGDLQDNWGIREESAITHVFKVQENMSTLESDWTALIKMYSSLNLTHTEDKLPALSGLAKVFWGLTQDDYIAGIWKQSFATGLAWYVDIRDLEDKSSRPTRYRAPSFSWACLDDKVNVATFNDGFQRSKPNTVDVTLESYSIICESSDPFGKIRGGNITLSGLIRKATTLGPYPTALGDTDKGHNPLYNAEMAPIGSMRIDVSDDIVYGEVTCLKLFGGTQDVFLVLRPTDPKNGGCETFTRIGLGDTMLWDRSKFGNEKFFDGAERSRITIV